MEMKPVKPENDGPLDEILCVMMFRDEKHLARELATLEGITLSEFTRRALRKEVEERLGADSEARP